MVNKMEILFLGLLLGLIPAMVAQSKGRSFLLWWFYGAMIFIIALPHSLLISSNQKLLDERKLNEGMKKCTYCAELIRPEAKICKFCNSEVVDSISDTLIHEDTDKFKVSFQAKDEDSWNNIKVKLSEFYKKYNIENIISNKDTSWMLGGDESIKGYIQATLNDNIIIVESFKLPKPDISIINSETKEKIVQTNTSTDNLIGLGKLLEKGLITKEEFEKEKNKILSS